MAFLHSDVYDNGLTVLQSANALHICKSLPATYAAATGAESVGVATGAAMPSISAPADKSGGGREVTIGAVTDPYRGDVTAADIATHFALVDTLTSRLLATRALASQQNVMSGNTFTLTSHKVSMAAAS